MVSNGDSYAGPEMISPVLYRNFALPYEQKVIAAAHDNGVPYILHICGNTDPILTDMLETGTDGLELDYKTNTTFAESLMKDQCVFLGNLDPVGVLERGSVEDVREKTEELLNVFSENPRLILNAGCAISMDTPSQNIRCLIETSRKILNDEIPTFYTLCVIGAPEYLCPTQYCRIQCCLE